MYRYRLDNSLIFTCEDLVLFRESPFASWMERLTLENPGHGILPDTGSEAPRDPVLPQDDVAATLRAEGHQVTLVEWEDEEPLRRNATLLAMRYGADFIVNGQLAAGSLSGAVNLLMKTRGRSELGQHLYVPCDTQGKSGLHSPFRLCFLADLLQSLQGELPPRMLIIHGGAELLPLQTEDHIYYYRAVKQRFLQSQQQFRKHRMPDPALSAHAGRWAICANEVLKQRAQQSVVLAEREAAAEAQRAGEQPQRVAAQAGAGQSSYDPDWVPVPGMGGASGNGAQVRPNITATRGRVIPQAESCGTKSNSSRAGAASCRQARSSAAAVRRRRPRWAGNANRVHQRPAWPRIRWTVPVSISVSMQQPGAKRMPVPLPGDRNRRLAALWWVACRSLRRHRLTATGSRQSRRALFRAVCLPETVSRTSGTSTLPGASRDERLANLVRKDTMELRCPGCKSGDCHMRYAIMVPAILAVLLPARLLWAQYDIQTNLPTCATLDWSAKVHRSYPDIAQICQGSTRRMASSMPRPRSR
ncbi:hypothetical protein [Kineobactrum salinum]|uniref:Uncharacterized protein n=1 Tax=Kineobactrum salinum TaxID=2708301 RepID=A0A6C0U9D1_9GAMM|nr:hypothetical protein [Kineobactrum salinum]QIB67245.1 hypothetical protein G3T16_19415 [Kineobactrum salinum]